MYLHIFWKKWIQFANILTPIGKNWSNNWGSILYCLWTLMKWTGTFCHECHLLKNIVPTACLRWSSLDPTTLSPHCLQTSLFRECYWEGDVVPVVESHKSLLFGTFFSQDSALKMEPIGHCSLCWMTLESSLFYLTFQQCLMTLAKILILLLGSGDGHCLSWFHSLLGR